MARLRKVFPRGTVLFVTSTVKEGLPFIPNSIINTILEGILARAQRLYGQEIIGYTYMANHFHKVIRVTKPRKVSRFVGYIKSESARAYNRLLGREQHDVWCDRYDSPIVLTAQDALDRIVYTYLNPVKARLVETVDEYPGLSSWSAFTSGQHTKTVKWIQPKTIQKLKKLKMTDSEEREVVKELQAKNSISHVLRISPNALFKTFPELKMYKPEVIKQQIESKVRAEEARYKKESPKVLGAKKVRRQALDRPYISRRHGRRTVFISSDVDLRVRAIFWYRGQCRLARDAWMAYRRGGLCKLPPGFFGPGGLYRSTLVGFMNFNF